MLLVDKKYLEWEDLFETGCYENIKGFRPEGCIFAMIYNYNDRYAMPKKKKKGKADLTTVLHIRELPHLHMKLAVWFSFPTTNSKNPMIPSWSLVSIYNYSFKPDQIFTKDFEISELEICSKIFTCGMIFLQVNSSLPTSLKKYLLSHYILYCASQETFHKRKVW